MVQTEGGINSQVNAQVIIADSNAASSTGVGAQLVRCLVGQRERVAVVDVATTGTSSGAFSCIVQGSAEGTTWVDIGTAVADTSAAATAEIVTATPWVRLYVTTQPAVDVWDMSLTVTE